MIDSPLRYGIFAHYNMNNDVAGFQRLPGIPNCCPNFESGSGTGFSFGLSFDYQLPYSLKTGLRIGLSTLNNKLTRDEGTFVRVGSDIVNGTFRHTIDASLTDLAFEPNITFNPIFGINLYAGASIGYLITKDYSQEERIVEPADRGVFVNTGTRVQNQSSGVIPNANDIYTSLFIGAGYELPLNSDGSLLIIPEAFYHIGLTNVVKEVKWKINTIKAGISLVYTPKPKEHVPIESHLKEEIIDTVTIEAKEITENKISTGIPKISNRIERNEDTIFFIETLNRTDTSYIQPGLTAFLNYKEPEILLSVNFMKESYPVLPVVFFDKMSHNIDNYYYKLDNKNSFNYETLDRNIVVYARNILNIIGKRMEKYPASTIQLKGYVDFERENRDCGLALKRAEEIKAYLINIWKIDERRIDVKNGTENCFPENVPSDKSDSAFAENRRVEIYTSNPELLASITFREPLDTAASFSNELIFDLTESIQKGIIGWQIVGTQKGVKKFDLSGTAESQIAKHQIDSSIIANELKGNPLEATLTVKDLNQRIAEDKQKINFGKIIKEDDKHIIFSILFGLADDRLSNKVKNELKGYIEKLDSAKVKITGYSDIIGGEKKNKMLSANRAKNTADLIQNINPKLEIISIYSYSFNKFPPGVDAYATPSERYLARTSLVEILKP